MYCLDRDDNSKTSLVLNMKARHKLRNQSNTYLVVSLLGVFVWSSLSLFVVICVDRNDYYLLNISMLSCVIVVYGSAVFSDLAEACSSLIIKRRVQRNRLIDEADIEDNSLITMEAVQKLSLCQQEEEENKNEEEAEQERSEINDNHTTTFRDERRSSSVLKVAPVSATARAGQSVVSGSDGMTSIYSVKNLGVNLKGLFYKNLTMSAISALSILLVLSRLVSFLSVSNSC